MCKQASRAPETDFARGFTFVELMVGMALLLLLLGIIVTIFDQLQNVSDAAATMADVNQNLRGAVNVMARDVSMTGWNVPLNGIPLPCGGSATTIKRPPVSASNTFPCSCPCNMTVITTGTGLGPASGSNTTDMITAISVNSSTSATATVSAITFTPPNSAVITVPSTLTSLVVAGQLIMLTNTNGSCLLAASAVNTSNNTITFNASDTTNDVMGLNQFATNITSGSLAQLKSGGTFPTITASLITMVTYYLSTATSPEQLMRLTGSGASSTGGAQAAALGIQILQISYDLSTGAANQRTGTIPTNNIRNVNLSITAVANHPNRKSRAYYTDTINTQVTVQNLAYFNKYGTSY
jgi:prepilin-type N-terminal cleavage/methylation domain-containing protein